MSASTQSAAEQPLDWEQRVSVLLAKRRWIAGVVCCAVAAIATLPLFVSGFPKGDDAIKHYRWSTEFAEALSDGRYIRAGFLKQIMAREARFRSTTRPFRFMLPLRSTPSPGTC